MEILSEDQNIIYSLDGKIQLEGVQTFAPNGTETYSSQEIIATSIPYKLNHTHNTNRHIYESNKLSNSEQEAMTIYAHNSGITSFTSSKFIYHNGVLYYGLPGSEFKFIAPEYITLSANILNHSTASTSVSAQLNVCGQALIGSARELNPMNTVSSLDPTGGSLADLVHSSNIPEAFVNGAASAYGISNMLGMIAQNGLMNTLASQMGASLTLSLTKTAFDYQTEGAGGFYGGANIKIQTNGVATFAINAHDKVAIFEVAADELRIFNTMLKSRFTSESISIAPSLNFDGSYDLSASYAYQSSSSISQLQRNLSIGTFNLNVRYLHNRGANIVCNKINGKVDTIENENTVNSTSSTQTQVSASARGNVSANHVHATEETEGAKASILVTDGVNVDPESNFEVNTVINHGDAKIFDLETGSEVVHVGQTLKSKRIGGGISHNVSNNTSTKLSTDVLNQKSVIDENGLTVTERSKLKTTAPFLKFTAPKEKSFIKLGETNDSNALSGRLPSIIGGAISKLESNDFLVDQGYRYGRPSNAPEAPKVKHSFQPGDLVLNRQYNVPSALRGDEYPSSPVVINTQFSPLPVSVANKLNLDASNINKISYTDAAELVSVLMAAPQGKGMLVAFVEAAVEVYKDTGKFLGEEAARLSLGEQTETSKIFHVAGRFIGEDIAKWHLGEDSFFKYMLTERGISRTFFGAVDYIVENDQKFANFVANATPEDWGKIAGRAAANYTLGFAQSRIINAPSIGGNILKPLTFARQTPKPRPINLELNNRMLGLKTEFDSLSKMYDYRALNRPVLSLFQPLGHGWPKKKLSDSAGIYGSKHAQGNGTNLAKNIGLNNNYIHKKQTGNGFYSGLADDAYDAIRTNKHDVSNIAKNTGFKENNIQKIKDHLFYDKHLLDRYVEYGIPAEMKVFDSDIAIANAWKRLEQGVHNKYDIQLLKHETAEAWYMRNHGRSYTNAHNAADKRYPAPDLETMVNDFGSKFTNNRG